MYCKKCGKELEDGAAFCQYCGQKQDKENEKEKETGKKDSIKEKTTKETEEVSNKKLFLLGAVIAVVILAVIGVVKLAGKSREDVTVEQSMVKEDVEEKKEEDMTPENEPELKEEKDKAEAAEEGAIEETKNPKEESQIGGLPESESPLVKYMKVGDSECWFDEDGDLVKMTRMTDGGWSMEIQYVTDAAGNKVCGEQKYLSNSKTSIAALQPFYNDKNYLINSVYYKVDSEIESYEFSYDENNRLIMEERVWEIAEGSENWQYHGEYLADKILLEYLENGNKVMISEQQTSANGSDDYTSKEEISLDNGNIVSLYWEMHDDWGYNSEQSEEWEYDTNGNIIRKSQNYNSFLNGSKDSTSYEEYKYDYDENKNVIREENNINGEISITVYQYDENGNLLRREIDDEITDTTVYQYDENGNLLKREIDVEKRKWIFAYQYDEAGRQTKYERKIERWNYDEEGNMTQQTTSDYNNIYEYDEEGKLISYAYLYSSTEGDVVSFDSWYLYDEQGRLSEIKVDEETAVTISYNEAGLPEKIDSVIEVDNNAIYWQIIYDLLPQDEMVQSYADYKNQDIMIEYR